MDDLLFPVGITKALKSSRNQVQLTLNHRIFMGIVPASLNICSGKAVASFCKHAR
jgi:hypothetical protein